MYAMYPVLQAAANGAQLATGALPPSDYVVAYAAVFGNYAEEAGEREKDADGSVWISESFARRVWEDSLGGDAVEAFAGFSSDFAYAMPEEGGWRIQGIGQARENRDLDAYTWLALAGDRYALLFRMTDELGTARDGYFVVVQNERSMYGFSLSSMTFTDGAPQLTEWVKPELTDGEYDVSLTAFFKNEYGEMIAEILTEDDLRYELIVPWYADVRLPARDGERLLYYDAEAAETVEMIEALIVRGARFALRVEDGEAQALTYVGEAAHEDADEAAQ